MPQLGPLEVLVVGVVALIVFGPQRLPEIARTVGRTLAQLRDMAAEVRTEFESGMNLDEVADEPEDESGNAATEPSEPAATARSAGTPVDAAEPAQAPESDEPGGPERPSRPGEGG